MESFSLKASYQIVNLVVFFFFTSEDRIKLFKYNLDINKASNVGNKENLYEGLATRLCQCFNRDAPRLLATYSHYFPEINRLINHILAIHSTGPNDKCFSLPRSYWPF